MAQRTDPFAPRTPLSRELLERYAQGGLTEEERHAVELHAEADPLVREALDGLLLPGAAAASAALEGPPRPGTRTTGRWLAGGALLLAAAVLLWSIRDKAPAPPEKKATTVPAPLLPAAAQAAAESTLQAVHAELKARPDAPAPPAAGPAAPERFENPEAASPKAERESIERLAGRPVTVAYPPQSPAPKTASTARPSRPLVFLHDMKVAVPRASGTIVLRSPGTPADRATARRDSIPSGPAALPYLDYMQEALNALAKGDEHRALDDFYYLLGQRPNDVNAQFYAGLACYRSGLYPRALRLFHAAATNPVDSFNEEAVWYQALTTAELDGKAAARPAFERIARAGGFYAQRAKARLEMR